MLGTQRVQFHRFYSSPFPYLHGKNNPEASCNNSTPSHSPRCTVVTPTLDITKFPCRGPIMSAWIKLGNVLDINVLKIKQEHLLCLLKRSGPRPAFHTQKRAQVITVQVTDATSAWATRGSPCRGKSGSQAEHPGSTQPAPAGSPSAGGDLPWARRPRSPDPSPPPRHGSLHSAGWRLIKFESE